MAHSPVDGFSPAHVMLQALREGTVSAVELLDLHLRRIDRYNPALNAIVTLDVEGAREAAAAADVARARGEKGPLLGLPMTVKDTIDVRGMRCTGGGIAEAAERIPDKDARIVASVREAGAVIMGKTNAPPYAWDWQASNPVFGRTNNPWDLSRTPGGSSGGSAAALAAGLTALELGSDIGGSVRLPAAFCGVYGHKASDASVPNSGHFPGTHLPNPTWTMPVRGPLARSAEDLQLAFDVISGADIGDEVAWRLQSPAARHERLEAYRVAVMPPIPWLPIDEEILAAQERLVDDLRRIGVRVEVTQPETFGDLRLHTVVYLSLFEMRSGYGKPEEERLSQLENDRTGIEEFDAALARGWEARAYDFFDWQIKRQEFRTAYRAFFREWDVLISPTSMVPAFRHTDAPWPERAFDIGGTKVAYILQSVYPSLATLAGQPATAFPIGRMRSGLPIGLQAIGPYLEDATPIRFAGLVAEAFGGFEAPDGYGG